MTTRTRSLFTCFLLFPVLGFLPLNGLRGGPLVLSSPVILSNRAVQLQLSGQTGALYSLEASSNLANWFLISSGIATNGLLTIRHDGATNYPRLFYRGQGTNSTVPLPTIAVAADTNVSANGLVSLDGGSCTLYGLDGTQFTLNLQSNSIPDPRLITLTLVTNVGRLPFSRGTLGTVVLGPPDLVFWGAASLEISFRTNIDRRQIVSFSSNGDGSAFRLTPDRVLSDRIVIPVMQAGVFGSSLATLQELTNLPLVRVNSGQSVASGGKARPKAWAGRSSTSECFPDKQAAADEAKSEIDAALNAQSQQTAVALGTERQQELLGDSDDPPSVLAQAAAGMCEFYETQIAPRWPDAMDNCALGQVLMQASLGLERQRQLLGDTNECISFSVLPLCSLFQTCLDAVSQCCAMGNKGPARITEVLSLERQDQLLGLGCISQSDAQQVIDQCSSNAWTGSFSMTGSGNVTTSMVQQVSTVTTVTDWKEAFDASVETSREDGSPPADIELTVMGTVLIHQLEKRTSTTGPTPCVSGGAASSLNLQQTDVIIATNSFYKIIIGINDDNTYTILAYNSDESQPDDDSPGTESSIEYSMATGCDGSESVNTHTFSFPTSFPAESLSITFAERLPMTETNHISGSYSFTDNVANFIPMQFEFKWDFTRQQVPP